MWVRARAASSIGIVSSVPTWFRADSGTNLIKQGEIVTGRPCGSVARWSECSHGLREVLCSSPGLFLPCDTNIMAHLDEYKLLSDRQHAFRKGHSCETQLTTVINDWAKFLDNRGQVNR